MVDPGTLRPTFGITALPEGMNRFRRDAPELKSDTLVATLEANGARLAWSRASICPCAGFNDQTRQPDPTCPSCRGGAVFYFGPKDYVVADEVGDLTAVQTAIVADGGAAVIRGVIQQVTQAQDFYDVIGNWVRGTMSVTVRPENKIGYYDRLVNLDSEVVFSQIVTVGADPTADLALRYKAISVNIVQSDADTGSVRFEQGEDFETVDGVIRWRADADVVSGMRLSVHYVMHPTWLVIDHPHVLREVNRRRDRLPRTTPLGNPTQLPIKATVRLEFLPSRDIPPSLAP